MFGLVSGLGIHWYKAIALVPMGPMSRTHGALGAVQMKGTQGGMNAPPNQGSCQTLHNAAIGQAPAPSRARPSPGRGKLATPAGHCKAWWAGLPARPPDPENLGVRPARI